MRRFSTALCTHINFSELIMANRKPKTIAEYIENAPESGEPHLKSLYDILKDVSPQAQETIKWGHPFFVEPRFVYAFSAHKFHVGFTSSNDALAPYLNGLEDFEITKMGILKIPYSKPFPKAIIKKIAKERLRLVNERTDTNFW